MKESVEPDQIQKPDDTEELLQRLTMGKSTASRAVQDNSEDTKENPYIYRQGHPHLDSHTDLDKIRKITEKLFFSSDEGANKMKEHRKKTKFSIWSVAHRILYMLMNPRKRPESFFLGKKRW